MPLKISNNGYCRMWLGGRLRLVHRLVAELYCERREGRCVRHLDGNPVNNHWTNLAFGTDAENVQDAKRHGTWREGTRNVNAKLTPEQVLAIKQRIEAGEMHKAIAADYSVSASVINSIALGKAYRAEAGPVRYTVSASKTQEARDRAAKHNAERRARVEARDARNEQQTARAVYLRSYGVPQADIAADIGRSQAFVSAATQGVWNGWEGFIAEQLAMGHSRIAVHKLAQAMIKAWRTDVHPCASMSVIAQRERAAGV